MSPSQPTEQHNYKFKDGTQACDTRHVPAHRGTHNPQSTSNTTNIVQLGNRSEKLQPAQLALPAVRKHCREHREHCRVTASATDTNKCKLHRKPNLLPLNIRTTELLAANTPAKQNSMKADHKCPSTTNMPPKQTTPPSELTPYMHKRQNASVIAIAHITANPNRRDLAIALQGSECHNKNPKGKLAPRTKCSVDVQTPTGDP
jgi:hypothetical protein